MSAAEQEASRPPAPFSTALTSAIARRGLTLQQLADQLKEKGNPVSVATLSYWQTGRTAPARPRSVEAVRTLEDVLRLPAGQLTGALPLAAPPTGARSPDSRQLRIHELLGELNFPVHAQHTTHTLQDSIDFSLDRREQGETTRQLLQSEATSLRRIPLLLQQDGEQRPAVEGLVGCSLGEMVQDQETGLLVVELLLSRPLGTGEMAMTQYRVVWPDVQDDQHGFARTITGATGHFVVDVCFTDQVPDMVEYSLCVGRPPDTDRPDARQPLPASDFVQVALSNPHPGLHRVVWGYR